MSVRAALYEFVEEFFMYCRGYHIRTTPFKHIVASLVRDVRDDELRAWVEACVDDDSEDPRYHHLWADVNNAGDCPPPHKDSGQQDEAQSVHTYAAIKRLSERHLKLKRTLIVWPTRRTKGVASVLFVAPLSPN